MSEIQLENLSYFHGKDTPYQIQALKNIHLTIPGGKITGLIGHTGSGKSTLVQMLNGLLRPDEGRVLLNGEDIWEKPKNIRSVRFRVGLVMQYPEYQLFEETVAKDIAFGPKNMGLGEEEIRDRVAEAARFAGLESELLEKSPFDLSGGQKRRAAIAGIIAMRPEILVLDEPAAGLDPRGRESIFENIVQYHRESNSTVVIVSHSMEDMARYCDHLVVMNEGEVLMQGDPNTVFSCADRLEEIGLDIPQITKTMLLLKSRGVETEGSIYTVEQALDAMLKLLKN
ncbi:MAG: energy-coupling factor transporter ATPase [Clostridia bacterium]|nr:energy-coupling factor transporter ATPase [Clostridia bacterium]